ncbi:MAG: biotin-dependent carboxyltransferase family protein [Phycisphaerales bacterium]
MSLRVTKVSGLATVQDLGRPGYAHEGVPASGAADGLSLRLANLVVGNDADAAGVEVALGSALFEAERACRVAINAGGRAFEAIEFDAGQAIVVTPESGLCRAYVALAGGIDVPPVLGSRATLLGAGIGGLDGRALRVGDVLPVGDGGGRPRPVTMAIRAGLQYEIGRRVLRVVTDGAEAQMPTGVMRVLRSSDRVGIRLANSASAIREPITAGRSRGVLHGTIQMPSPDELVILGPDGPTTGGYPTVGTIIAADLPAVGQLVPGQWVRFEVVSREEAIEIVRTQHDLLARIN